MSLDPASPDANADMLLASAATLSAHILDRRGFATRYLFRPEHERIDDQVRIAFTGQLRHIVDTIAAELVAPAERILASDGYPEAASSLTQGPSTYVLLAAHDLLSDADLVDELLGRVELDAIADRLTGEATEDPGRPSLLARLIEHPDRVISHAARALLAADSRHRDSQEEYPIAHSDLSAERQHRLTWQVAAALRTRCTDCTHAELAAVDAALAISVRRSLRAYDEGERLEAVATRLAVALNTDPADLPELLLDALGDRRIALFVAVLARAIGTDYAAARALVLDSDGIRLWVALRALHLSRPVVAQIGFTLSEADRRRDLEQFVDRIDLTMELSPDDAIAALSILRSDPVYRNAVAMLAKRGRFA